LYLLGGATLYPLRSYSAPEAKNINKI
jgi:hypothetical protein